MSVSTRLQSVTQNLSPLQRALLVIQAIREDRDVDPDVKDFKDEQQRRVFNRYMALLWVANHYVGVVSTIISFRVQMVDNEKARFLVLNEAADILDDAEGKPRTKGERNWRKQSGDIEVSAFLRGLALECRDDGVTMAEHLWGEMLALEQLWRDLSADFAGEDLVVPEHRERVDQAKKDLRELARTLGLRKLPTEPNEASFRQWMDIVSDAFHRLGLAGPY